MIAQPTFRFTPERSTELAAFLADLIDQVYVEAVSEDRKLMLWVRDLLRSQQADWWLLAAAGNAAWDRAHSLERPDLRDPPTYALWTRDSRQSRRQAARIAALKAAAYSAYAMSALCKHNAGRLSQVARFIEDAIEASAASAAASNAAFLGENLEAAIGPLED
jgi:hypothetical protein